MKFINNIGLYSFLLLILFVILVIKGPVMSKGLNILLLLLPFAGGVTGLVRHVSKREITFSILTILLEVGFVLMVISAISQFQ